MSEEENDLEQEARKELRKKKLSEIEPFTDAHVEIRDRSDLAKVVEGPLLSACQKLYDRNIRTYMSSANKEALVNAEPVAEFSINYEALSERNREIAEHLIEAKVAELVLRNYTGPSRLIFSIPVTTESTWGEIEDKSNEIADRFVAQRYMPEAYSPEFLVQRFAAQLNEDIPEGEEVRPDYFESYGYFYDSGTGLFFANPEDIRKLYEHAEGEDEDAPIQLAIIHQPER
jgi:hypothetical protein